MPIEFEAKILNVDPEETTAVILAAGGRRVQPATLMRRRVYDIVAGDESRWIRLRDTGVEVTVAVKEIAHDGIDGTRETEVRVDDFDMAGQLLSRLGFTAKSYQENRRTSFLLDGARLEIDEWPLIPAYLEIEGDSREHVLRVATRLGRREEELTGENTTKVYARYGLDLRDHGVLTF